MAIKKSELYSSLWKSCDELRGGMDASQYKDYILVLLFIKYISDKYAGGSFPQITVPQGAGFKDMAALKGDPEIGDKINKKIIEPIISNNEHLRGITIANFNDPDKLGGDKEMVKKLSNLIEIFEDERLDFSKNRADGDDILGDAYEYLMRNFATESGKSKGQFYTPAEVSRVMAKIIGINSANTKNETTVYDPTCGSGSLLLRVADEAEASVSLYGQEMDVTTVGLAKMNCVLHGRPTVEIRQGNTLADPKFKLADNLLKQFDFAVANPPFSYKSWSNGFESGKDKFNRFELGVPPAKNGDYAFLLHFISSLNDKGKGAIILPHGVLFRGNSEGLIRRKLLGDEFVFIKGIIGLPPNLFYGTGIPACIIVIDKENAKTRKGIFFIDASKGFMKDGPKNRLREQDIHKIVDVFTNVIELPKYSRMVPISEIKEKECNLNIPRYIDSQEPEDVQDIYAHLHGGIPNADIDLLNDYWEAYPSLKKSLFGGNGKKGYSVLKTDKDAIKQTIYEHPEFIEYSKIIEKAFASWRRKASGLLVSLEPGVNPKKLVHMLSEDLLSAFAGLKLIDKYDVYQRFMNYWQAAMQDDIYMISYDGWLAAREIEKDKKQFEGKLLPKELIINKYYADEKAKAAALEAELEKVEARISELEEEHGGDEGLFSQFDKVNKAAVDKRIKELSANKKALDKDEKNEFEVLTEYSELSAKAAALKKDVKDAQAKLDALAEKRYALLDEKEIKELLVACKWVSALEAEVHEEMNRISWRLTRRVKELAGRYGEPLLELNGEVEALEAKVKAHINKMGLEWK